MGILIPIFGLASLVCFIMVLIKMFKTEKPIQGILGIITCGIWAFIWGWMNAGKHGLQKIMLIWTICIVANIVVSVMTGGASFSFHAGTSS